MNKIEISNSVQELADYFVDIINDDHGNKPARLGKLFEDYKNYLKAEVSDPDRGPREENDDDKMTDKLRAMVDAMLMSVPSMSRQQAAHYLLHTSHGRRLAEHLNNHLSKGEIPMDRTSELLEIAKADGGMAMIAKGIIGKGETSFTEHEFSAALMEYAKQDKNRRTGESAVSAYSRHLETNGDFRKALGIAKGYKVHVRKEGGGHSVETPYDVEARMAGAKKAYEKLIELGQAQYPNLEPAAAFAKAFEHNPGLARVAAAYSINAADDADGTGRGA